MTNEQLIAMHQAKIDRAQQELDRLNTEICSRYALWNRQYDIVKEAKAEIAKLK